jgi:ribose transport system substrate-binding protein
MLDVLTAHPQLGGVFSATDDYGLGVAQALVKAKKLGVANVSIDGDPHAVQDIIDGNGMNAEIAQDFKQMGYRAVKTLADAIDGKPVPKEIILATPLITKANAQQYREKSSADSKPSK